MTGVRAGQPLSRERSIVQGADAVAVAEGNTDGCDIASTWTALRGLRTWHVRTLLVREPGDLQPDHAMHGWPASGRRGAVADDARAGEVRLLHSSCEADEQTRATECGAGGAKGGGQGELGRDPHAPDTEPGKRAPGT
ncbi:MAG: hypothetical protein MZV70_57030 [Desulfobacterales bacterium]|nr:hypothetical protein [Desulfobacterales bacterium]